MARSGGRGAATKRWLGLVFRVLLGGVLLAAGALKVTKPEVSARSVQAYDLLPFDVATYVGYGLPLVEIVLGVLLIAGLFTRTAAVLSGVLMVVFTAGIASGIWIAILVVGEPSQPWPTLKVSTV